MEVSFFSKKRYLNRFLSIFNDLNRLLSHRFCGAEQQVMYRAHRQRHKKTFDYLANRHCEIFVSQVNSLHWSDLPLSTKIDEYQKTLSSTQEYLMQSYHWYQKICRSFEKFCRDCRPRFSMGNHLSYLRVHWGLHKQLAWKQFQRNLNTLLCALELCLASISKR